MVRKFLYNLLFVDQDTNKISHSKFFACVASVSLTIAFFLMIHDLDAWMIYGGLLLGNHLGTRWTNNKSGITIENKNE